MDVYNNLSMDQKSTNYHDEIGSDEYYKFSRDFNLERIEFEHGDELDFHDASDRSKFSTCKSISFGLTNKRNPIKPEGFNQYSPISLQLTFNTSQISSKINAENNVLWTIYNNVYKSFEFVSETLTPGLEPEGIVRSNHFFTDFRSLKFGINAIKSYEDITFQTVLNDSDNSANIMMQKYHDIEGPAVIFKRSSNKWVTPNNGEFKVGNVLKLTTEFALDKMTFYIGKASFDTIRIFPYDFSLRTMGVGYVNDLTLLDVVDNEKETTFSYDENLKNIKLKENCLTDNQGVISMESCNENPNQEFEIDYQNSLVFVIKNELLIGFATDYPFQLNDSQNIDNDKSMYMLFGKIYNDARIIKGIWFKNVDEMSGIFLAREFTKNFENYLTLTVFMDYDQLYTKSWTVIYPNKIWDEQVTNDEIIELTELNQHLKTSTFDVNIGELMANKYIPKNLK